MVRIGRAPRQALTLGVRIACGCQMRQPGNLGGGGGLAQRKEIYEVMVKMGGMLNVLWTQD